MIGLRKIMKDNNIAAKELAAITQFPIGSIYKYSTGERTPSMYRCKILAKALNCTIDELLIPPDTANEA